MTRTQTLVRYVSPYGSPAWMTREAAERHLADRRYLDDMEVGNLSERQRQIGAPHIEEVPKR